MSIDNHNLTYSTWNCKFHVVFAPSIEEKYFVVKNVDKLVQFLGDCASINVNIIDAEVCPDQVHMLVEIPPKLLVAGFMGYLKVKSTVLIYQRFPSLFLKYSHREFWWTGYYVDTVGKNTSKIKEPAQSLKFSESARLLVAAPNFSRQPTFI